MLLLMQPNCILCLFFRFLYPLFLFTSMFTKDDKLSERNKKIWENQFSVGN